MTDDDRVFKALADTTRRHLLDRLFVRDGRTLTELEAELEMTRFGVMKHLRVLEDAGLGDDRGEEAEETSTKLVRRVVADSDLSRGRADEIAEQHRDRRRTTARPARGVRHRCTSCTPGESRSRAPAARGLTCDYLVTYYLRVNDDDLVFKALADPTRRFLLDTLFERDGRTLTELESELDITRFGVMKHLRVLEDAGLVVTRRSGREKLHFLNPVPIRLIHDRLIDKYTERRVSALTELKTELEREP